MFHDFMSSGSHDIQSFQQKSTKLFNLSNFIFKTQINFSHQRKSEKPKSTLLGTPISSC